MQFRIHTLMALVGLFGTAMFFVIQFRSWVAGELGSYVNPLFLLSFVLEFVAVLVVPIVCVDHWLSERAVRSGPAGRRSSENASARDERR